MDLATEVALRLDPSRIMHLYGMVPDPWQETLLRSTARRALLVASRQLGKSTAVAFASLVEAYLNPGSLTLMVSRSQDQADYLFKKVSTYHKALRLVDSVKENLTSLELVNVSTVVALPCNPDTIRGYSPTLAIIDEASRASDEVLTAILPALEVTQGGLLCLSTPRGKTGFFYDRWSSDDPAWLRINAKASESPRYTAEGLAQQRADLGERMYANEYENVFIEETDSVFTEDEISAILNDDEIYSGDDGIDVAAYLASCRDRWGV